MWLPKALLPLAVCLAIPELCSCVFHWAWLGPQSSLQSVDLTELLSDCRHGCVPDLGKWAAGHNYLETNSSMPQPQIPGACQHFWAFHELLSNFPPFHSFHYTKQVTSEDALQILPLCFCSHFTVPGAAILPVQAQEPPLGWSTATWSSLLPLQNQSSLLVGTSSDSCLHLPLAFFFPDSVYICWSKSLAVNRSEVEAPGGLTPLPSSLQYSLADDYSDPFDAKNDLKSKAGKGESSTGYMEPYEAQDPQRAGKHRHLRSAGRWMGHVVICSLCREGVYFGGGGWGWQCVNLPQVICSVSRPQEEPGRAQ